MATIGEMMTASSIAHWSLTGRERPVKVMGISAANHMASGGAEAATGGYITLEKYLWGLNCDQIERILGLRTAELRPLAHVFAFARLPTADEVEFKFSAAFPDGRATRADASDDGAAFHAAMMNKRQDYLEGRNLYERSITPAGQFYPPGSGMVPQWRLKVPLPVAGLIATVTPVIVFPRPNGSVARHRPHNRGPVR